MIKRKPLPLKSDTAPLARPMMPGSFDAQPDTRALIDDELHGINWSPVQQMIEPISFIGSMDKTKDVVISPAAEKLPELRPDVVDWRRYDPPAALRKAPNITSHVLLEILQSSVDKVRQVSNAEIHEEDVAKERALEEELASEREEKQKQKRPYLPIILVEDTTVLETAWTEPRSSQDWPLPRVAPEVSQPHDISTMAEDSRRSRGSAMYSQITSGLVVLPGSLRVTKTRDSAIRRLFKRSTEKGESSADGSARESLLQRLMDTKGANDLTTAEQKTDFAVAKLKRRLKSAQTPEPLRCDLILKTKVVGLANTLQRVCLMPRRCSRSGLCASTMPRLLPRLLHPPRHNSLRE